MKTVITCINSKFIHSSLAPWCLLSGIHTYAKMPHDAVVREYTVNQNIKDVVAALAAERADCYAFCVYIWNVCYIQTLLPLLKAAVPSCTVILGGPEVSYRSQSALEELGADYVCVGEGEKSFPALLDAIVNNVPTAPIVPSVAVDVPPSPFIPAYFETLHNRIAYIEGSRGCPFSCGFCLSGRDDCLRLFPLEQVKKDILRLAVSGAKTIKFVDRTFNCHKQRCEEILQFILSEYGKNIPTDVCFHFEVAADLFQKETLDLLATAPKGLFQMEAGLQSFHQPTLEAVTRKTDTDAICRNVQTILSAGNIHLHIDLIAGLPYEDFATFRQSFNKAYALQPHMLQLGFLKLLHGSALRKEIEKHAYVYSANAPYEVYTSRYMTKKEFAQLHAIEDVLERLYNSGRFVYTLQYIFKTVDVSPFDLFSAFADYLKKYGVCADGISLDTYIGYVWAFFSALPKIDTAVLKDALILDCYTSRQIHRLPPSLFEKDPRIAKINRQLGKSGIKRGIAILQSKKNTVAVVEYTNRDRVTSRYPLQLLPLDSFAF
ncbi:MAG: DUF4080 domain-containing protein [Clostridia bacterium]|nr:DUF4080 domain-containing protein [Clostridia bacterium]